MSTSTYASFAAHALVKTDIVKKDPLSTIMLNAAPTKVVAPTRPYPMCNLKPTVGRTQIRHKLDIKYAVFADLGLSNSPVANCENDPLSVMRRRPQASTYDSSHSFYRNLQTSCQRPNKSQKSAMTIACTSSEELGELNPAADSRPLYRNKHLSTAISEADQMLAKSPLSTSACNAGVSVLQVAQDVDDFCCDLKAPHQRLFKGPLTTVQSKSDESSSYDSGTDPCW